ncbi:hypothetical protein KIN20_030354 [Parelaphostrongylus tenuis]|uniref:Uncharacterized protein n=1 Tax=Parelaphostrongylus tenuis TaxID=148309 RepID=A0AAD5WGE5_PARTN|nr:hypothetical protein KIN20_030354 [Parelaphostrongylus tenuis]
MGAGKISQRSIIVGGTVTGICTRVNGDPMCSATNGDVSIMAPTSHTPRNIIMANWSRQMWQSVVDRAVRMLASGPFASNFFSASATVSEN